MSQAGFTDIAVSLAVKLLQSKGMLDAQDAEDTRGAASAGYYSRTKRLLLRPWPGYVFFSLNPGRGLLGGLLEIHGAILLYDREHGQRVSSLGTKLLKRPDFHECFRNT